MQMMNGRSLGAFLASTCECRREKRGMEQNRSSSPHVTRSKLIPTNRQLMPCQGERDGAVASGERMGNKQMVQEQQGILIDT